METTPNDPNRLDHKQSTKSPSVWEQNRTFLKGIVIGLLILIMLIPAAIINNLVRERAERKSQVVYEVSSKWADPQTVLGPILAIPYSTSYTNSGGKTVTEKRLAYFLPDQLSIGSDLATETRHRSIYDVTLYRSGLDLKGSFENLNLEALNIAPSQLHWSEAKLLVGLNDMRGLEDEVTLNWNGEATVMEPLDQSYDQMEAGLSSNVALTADKPISFSLTMKIKGSETLYFTPVGKITSVSMKSQWKDPAFDGKYLPSPAADISNDGFTAKWKVLQASRPFPQQWVNSAPKIAAAAFGVKLLQPTDSYVKTERSVKYALLFISLTFGVFFILELLQKRQIHPLQYLLVGVALLVFYSLLLSISEYQGFNKAYVIAAAATVSLIGWYVWIMFRRAAVAVGFTVAIGALYAYIFFLIQLQDYALLFGSVGLFLVVAMAMYFTRKVDWYNIGKRNVVLETV